MIESLAPAVQDALKSITPVHIAALAIGFTIVAFLSAVGVGKKSHLPLPPSPPKRFIYGNAADIPKKHKHKKWLEWGKQYARKGAMTLSIFGKPVIVLHEAKAVFELLDKRSAIYSSRPKSHMGDFMGYSSSTLLSPYGEDFRKMRRLMNFALNSRVVKTYWPIQERVAQDFTYNLLTRPNDQFDYSIKLATGSAILQIAYGYKSKEDDDPQLKLGEEATYNFGLAVGGGFWIDYLPWMKYVPLMFWHPETRKYVEEGRELSVRIRNDLHDIAKKDIENGTAIPNFTSILMASDKLVTESKESEEKLIKRVSSILYGAGSDSSAATAEAFFLAMTLHPEVMKRAQEELDAVVGQDRYTTMDDRESLPYIDALTKELLRWACPVPIGVPHSVIEDDVYEDMFIPKDATVIANIWALAHDEKEYPEPFSFKPERFLVENPPMDPWTFIFGFGRRQCPGMNVAAATAFLGFSNIIKLFDIKKAVDPKTGLEITPEVEWTSGLINHAVKHPLSIKPRNAACEELIRTTRMVNEGN